MKGFSETEKCRKNHLFEWYFEFSVISRCSKIARFWLKFAQKVDFWYEYMRKRQRHTFEEDWASSLSILEQKIINVSSEVHLFYLAPLSSTDSTIARFFSNIFKFS
ncbi:unnamed protein product [Caenorhabditis angaria]|uniref:Uncharacterized protein n=1 Tax=Caenorhabditis angaria TaxID=860376 RepID=A0A9P1N4Z1_9PELO|nr:unnamed protein product [Caenorhabditis angaria]